MIMPSKYHTDKLWKDWANDLGFDSEKSMFETLYREWQTWAIADLIGVSESTAYNRLKKIGVKLREPRGKGHIATSVRCISNMKIKEIKRRHRMMHEGNWSLLARQFNVHPTTAKKYAIPGNK